MRQARIRGQGLSYYHVISRVVDRRFILGDEEREHFVVLMRKLEAFLGLRVVTYVVMSNHFHLLIEEPDRDNFPAMDRETLLQRLGYLYKQSTVDGVREELDRASCPGGAGMGTTNLCPISATHGGCLHFHEGAKTALQSMV